jgi:hypothetical protein
MPVRCRAYRKAPVDERRGALAVRPARATSRTAPHSSNPSELLLPRCGKALATVGINASTSFT